MRMLANPFASPFPDMHLWLDICIVVILQEQSGRLGIILAGGNVQGRQSHFALGVVLQKDGDHLVMTLLQSDGEGSEAILQITGDKKLINKNIFFN